jgi:hypothetical protein
MSPIAETPQGEPTTHDSGGRRSSLRDILRSQIAAFKATSATITIVPYADQDSSRHPDREGRR